MVLMKSSFGGYYGSGKLLENYNIENIILFTVDYYNKRDRNAIRYIDVFLTVRSATDNTNI